MIVPPLIEQKRNGVALSDDQWAALITAYCAGKVPDYQMAALLMAVWFRGLSDSELMALTASMRDSGDCLNLADLDRPRVDKHSTGGVGDKTSLILAPMMAACGLAVPMISGRGLGHTGGTVDKLESIPGFRTDLTLRETEAQVRRLGCAMLGQTGAIAQADKKLYALRDVTATIDSIPLIATSIMSKKLAEDLNGLVLDVKTGSGAFMPDPAAATSLAQTMIHIGEVYGCRTVALLTAMDRPLGFACGNALEVEECIQALDGNGPQDLMEVTYALGVAMLQVGGIEAEPLAARQLLEEAVGSGRALGLFERIITAQGGNPLVVRNTALLPQAPARGAFEAETDGLVLTVEPRRVGRGITALGGGRERLTDDVDPRVGFVITIKPGDRVVRGQPLATIHARSDSDVETGRQVLREAILIGQQPVSQLPLIARRISADGIQDLDQEIRP